MEARIGPGRRLGHYRLQERIGAGGMGEVYRAQDVRLKRPVAVKVMLRESFSRMQRERFQREARAISALNHPHICTLYDVGSESGTDFLVMELVVGETLSRRLQAGALPLAEAVKIGVEIADALDAAHRVGTIHRDLKPGNIMLTEHGAKLLDFGLAKAIEAPSATDPLTNNSTLTQGIVGTPQYMSPEQLKGMTLDGRSDIWSLGVVLYEMAAGKRLFEGTTATDIAVSVVTTGPTKMSRLTRGIPRRLKEVIGKCLAIDREERYQNVRDLLLDLKALQRRLETRSGSSRLPTSRVFSAMAGQAGGRRPAKRSIAVLPFAYAGTAKGPGRDPDEQYLADGVTETIINCLSRVADLRVIARSSAFRYRDLEADLEKVASALGVRHLLVGRILHDAEEIRISVELVSSQRQVWGEQYRLRPDRLADLPAEIAGEVARTLCPPDAKPAPRARTPNPEAYRAYLKGRHFWNKRTAQGLQKAVEHFQQAIAADPGYALAYVGLADCHHVMWVYTADTSPRDFYPIAKAEVMKALEIEPDLAEAHATLAAIKGDNEWEFAAAEREFRRAIELNPNYATAYQWLGEILTYTGRFKEALELLKTAHDLDPLSPVIAAVAGDVLLRAGRYERAIEELQVALQIDENFGLAHTTLRDAYELMGDFEQATVHEEIAEMLAGATAEAAEAHATGLRQAYVEGGEPAYWRMRLDHALHRFQESASWYDSSPFRIAEMCARLGEPEQACDWLERALKGGDVRVVYARSSPAFGKLQSHPRFAALVSSSGVPQPATAAPTGEERF